MVAWNVGVKAAEAACKTKISTYTCQIASTNGRQIAMAARTRSRLTSMARRGN